MDITKRKITKIAREAEKLVLVSLREEGVGTAGNRPDTRTAPQSRMHSGKARGDTARGQSCNREKDEKS